MSNLMVRLTTAIVALPLLTYLILLGGIPFTILIAAAVTIALHEFNMMMMARGFKPVKTVTYILGVLLVGVAYFSNEYYLTVLVTFSALIIMVVQLSKRDVNASIIGMAVTVLGLLYIPWLLAHAVLVRGLDSAGNRRAHGDAQRRLRGGRHPPTREGLPFSPSILEG